MLAFSIDYYEMIFRVTQSVELFCAYCATTPSPYYAPNGLPYKYNPSTNTLEEITPEEE